MAYVKISVFFEIEIFSYRVFRKKIEIKNKLGMVAALRISVINCRYTSAFTSVSRPRKTMRPNFESRLVTRFSSPSSDILLSIEVNVKYSKKHVTSLPLLMMTNEKEMQHNEYLCFSHF